MHLQEDGQGCDHAEIDSANIVHGTRAGRGVNTAPRLEDEQSDVEDPDGAADVYEYMETLDLSDDELLGDQEREDAVEETATGQMLEGGDVQACVEQEQGEAQDGLVVQESAIAGGGSGLFLRDDIEPVAEGSGVGWFYGTRVTDAEAAALPWTHRGEQDAGGRRALPAPVRVQLIHPKRARSARRPNGSASERVCRWLCRRVTRRHGRWTEAPL